VKEGEMPSILVRDMTPDDEYFVSTCSHVNESDEIDACGRRRLAWLKRMHEKGLRVKVALLDGRHVGFIYMMPIEISTWDFDGEDLMAIPCLWVIKDETGKGVGRALLASAEEETRLQGKKGLAIGAYHHDFWFMPAPYFESLGFKPADQRKMTTVVWKAFDPSARPPRLMKRRYEFKPQVDKVVVDLFWNPLCQTSDIEAQRVREVVAEFGTRVVLNEYPADDREILLRYQTPRGIFINGKEIYWGYEAPRDGLRDAISDAIGAGSG
jgi:GNAT superfamily N-acetyltransferase